MNVIGDDEIRGIVSRVLNQALGLSSAAAPEAAPAAPTNPGAAEISPQPPPQVIAIGADHGGFELKEILKPELAAAGWQVIDAGTHSREPVDYPDIAHEVAVMVSTGKACRGIVIDGAGIGSCMVANKVPGVRAGLAYDHASAVNSRAHNDANLLTLGAGLIGVTLARQIVRTWLSTPFEGGRHAGRVAKITVVERQHLK